MRGWNRGGWVGALSSSIRIESAFFTSPPPHPTPMEPCRVLTSFHGQLGREIDVQSCTHFSPEGKKQILLIGP
jgi:hypothetical protein